MLSEMICKLMHIHSRGAGAASPCCSWSFSGKQEIVVCKRSIASDFFIFKRLVLLSGGSFGATSAVYEALSRGRMCEC